MEVPLPMGGKVLWSPRPRVVIGLDELVIGETLPRTYKVGRRQANSRGRDGLCHRIERGQDTNGKWLDGLHQAVVGQQDKNMARPSHSEFPPTGMSLPNQVGNPDSAHTGGLSPSHSHKP